MTVPDIGRLRLHNQQIACSKCSAAAEVVAWLGAIQAQDYAGARRPGAEPSNEEENYVGLDLIASLRPIHHQLANTGIIYMFVCGVWGAYMTLRRQPMNASYRGILVIGYGLGLLIGLLGLVMLLSGAQPRDPLHILYGLVLAVSLPGAAAYFSERSDERKPLIYAITSFFVFGIMIRGVMTGT